MSKPRLASGTLSQDSKINQPSLARLFPLSGLPIQLPPSYFLLTCLNQDHFYVGIISPQQVSHQTSLSFIRSIIYNTYSSTWFVSSRQRPRPNFQACNLPNNWRSGCSPANIWFTGRFSYGGASLRVQGSLFSLCKYLPTAMFTPPCPVRAY